MNDAESNLIFTRDSTPGFPTVCVGCGADRPEAHARVVTVAHSAILFPSIYTIRIPCCARCRGKIYARQVFDLLWTVVIVVSTVALARFVFMPVMSTSAAASLGVGMIAAGFLKEILSRVMPPAVRIRARDSGVRFRFRDTEYARRFNEFNLMITEQLGNG